MESLVPKTSPEGIRKFMEGHLYRDFLTELDVRIKECRDAFEVPEKELADGITYEMTRGAVRFAREVKEIFDDILISAENALADKEKEDKNGS